MANRLLVRLRIFGLVRWKSGLAKEGLPRAALELLPVSKSPTHTLLIYVIGS